MICPSTEARIAPYSDPPGSVRDPFASGLGRLTLGLTWGILVGIQFRRTP